MAESWSTKEVNAAVSDYFEMLALERRRLPFNKAQHNRHLQTHLLNRTKGSVEKKHQNISAILIALGCPYIDGYKPLGNYQQLLYTAVEERLRHAADLHHLLIQQVEQPIAPPAEAAAHLPILVDTPRPHEVAPKLYDQPRNLPQYLKRNYLEIESRNRTLGLAGEKLILEFEHRRLWEAGKRDLADRIEHVSDTTGDHLGFDIHSFETYGRDRLIEVKTTQFGEYTPFFASKNEVTVSETRENHYQLYRLFNFTKKPKLYTLPAHFAAPAPSIPRNLLPCLTETLRRSFQA